MRNTPLIAIVSYGRNDNHEFPLPAEYVDSVRRAGGHPILLPPGSDDFAPILSRIDGFVMSGGGDIDPKLYGGSGHAENYMIDSERDRSELALVRALLESGHPTLYVCRGTQMLNIALGGDLIEHIPDVYGEGVIHRLPGRKPVDHSVAIQDDTQLARLIGTSAAKVRSWHHQALKRLGSGLTAIAWSDDDVIEAVELETQSWVCAVQWHPELTAATEPGQQALFTELVAQAQNFASKRG